MSTLHDVIARGLATELRLFCRPLDYHGLEGDWFRWECDSALFDVQLFDGRLAVVRAPEPGVAGRWPVTPLVMCDLADPGLVDLLRVKLGR